MRFLVLKGHATRGPHAEGKPQCHKQSQTMDSAKQGSGETGRNHQF